MLSVTTGCSSALTSMRSEYDAHQHLSAASAARLYRQVDRCSHIARPIASRSFLQRLWASIYNWL